MLFRLLIILFILPSSVFSEDVIFCERVDASGHYSNSSDRFKISNKGGFVKILVNYKRRINTQFVIFDVYSLKDGKENFENSIRMNTNPFNNWFYKELTFFKQGEFIVYVYDERDQMLGIGKVTTFFSN
jgi:hypothetical protein